ncbi:carbohydrate ABC transporter permease [Nakamurella lactea]|uniref:carbohydrate ABC transporter permease n=1 Tax=Nakamurella lactea TaxID=459515 RepID=UPI00048E846C
MAMPAAGSLGENLPENERNDANRPPGPLSRSNVVATLVTGYLPLLLATLIIALPLIWMVLGSLKSPDEIVTQDLVLLPKHPDLDAYGQAAERISIGRLFLNSAIVTVVGSTIKVILAITSAYAFVFVRFPFKRVLFVGVLVALMVPPQVALVPNYVLISGLGGVNTYWGIILPGLGTAFGTFLLRQHFLSLPTEIMEAAEIDGASHFKRMMRVVVPISGPTIVTVALVTIVNEWNDYIWPLVITNDESRMTLPVGLTLLRNIEGDASAYPVLMAGAVMVIVPVLVIFAALQRFIVAGLTQGAVK